MENITQQLRLWVTKYAIDFCATLRKASPKPHCPVYKQKKLIEDKTHQLHFDDQIRCELWIKSTKKVEAWLRKMDIDPTILRCITRYILKKGPRNMETIYM